MGVETLRQGADHRREGRAGSALIEDFQASDSMGAIDTTQNLAAV
jgi:hypothetical protein